MVEISHTEDLNGLCLFFCSCPAVFNMHSWVFEGDIL